MVLRSLMLGMKYLHGKQGMFWIPRMNFNIFQRLTRVALPATALLFGTVAPAPAQQLRREIWVENACKHSVRLLIHHADGYRNWHPHAWFNLAANTSTALRSTDNVILTQSDGHQLYIYATTTDGDHGHRWEGNDTSVQWEGWPYNLRQVPQTVVGGRVVVRLTC